MIYYQHDHKLNRPFASLLSGIERFLELATPASRMPVGARIRKTDPGPPARQLWADGMDAKPGLEARMLEVVEKIRTHAADPGCAMSLHWRPDFPGPTDSSFGILGIDPRVPGARGNFNHQLILNGSCPEGADPAWVMMALVLPFDPGTVGFSTFCEQADAALGFRLAPSGFRLLERTRAGGFKTRKLPIAPVG